MLKVRFTEYLSTLAGRWFLYLGDCLISQSLKVTCEQKNCIWSSFFLTEESKIVTVIMVGRILMSVSEVQHKELCNSTFMD